MSERYESEIREAERLFAEYFALANTPYIQLTDAQYRCGTDSVRGTHRGAIDTVFAARLNAGYELSYNQICKAFFSAADKAGKLSITM